MTATDDQARHAATAEAFALEHNDTGRISGESYLAMRPGDAGAVLAMLKHLNMGAANTYVGVSRTLRLADLYPDEVSNVDPATEALFVTGLNPLAEYEIDWSEFWIKEHAEEWICEPIFAAGRAHSIYAGAKTGKSYITLAACAAVASGRAFLGKPAGEKRHMLYLDMEMTEEDVRDRLVEFGYGPDDDLSHLHYILLPSLPPLDTPEGGIALLTAAQAFRAEFVIIDTIGRVLKGTENEADTIQAFSQHTGKILKREGIGVARLAHAGKDADRGQRGSSAANDDVDVVLKLSRTDDGQKLTATHRRMSWYPEVTEVAIVEGNDGVMSFTSATSNSWPAGTAGMAAELDRLGVPTEMGRPAIRKAYPGLEATNVVLNAAIKFRKTGGVTILPMPSESLSDKAEKTRKTVRTGAGQANVNHNSDSAPDSSKNPYKSRPDSASDSSDSSPGQTPDSSVSLDTDSRGDEPSEPTIDQQLDDLI